jgi:hypothetical protein
MRTITTHCWSILLVLSAFATADVGLLHLRPLHLELPPTWRFDGSKNPIEGFGPDGEKALISVMRRKTGAGTGPSASEVARGFANSQMAEIAVKGGKSVIRPVSPLPAPEGKTVYSAASERSGLFGKSYFIQYLLSAKDASIFITFEGRGDATSQLPKFDAIISTQKWDE